MKCKFLLLILIVFSFFMTGCLSRQPWTKRDKVMFGMACAANAYDYYTTERFLDKNERNFIVEDWRWLYLGEDRPSDGLLAISKMAQMGLAWEVLDRVPTEGRRLVLFLMTGTWVYYSVNNK